MNRILDWIDLMRGRNLDSWKKGNRVARGDWYTAQEVDYHRGRQVSAKITLRYLRFLRRLVEDEQLRQAERDQAFRDAVEAALASALEGARHDRQAIS